ncbi:MAG: hypothetical protein AMJ81_03780 [Phycisphaerae bacterium SM23_33]|nr:MAG: hypothetical protein AMJ81_03780 [Phycisphaerae bacterium SM23_33]
MLRVLLINAPAREVQDEPIVVPPLGLAYLAAAARDAGHDVSILDAFAEALTWDQFQRRLAGEQFDVIGLTGMTPVFDTVQRAIQICRPHARRLILGGPHATAFRHSVLADNPQLDFAVYGEGELTFVELLEAVEQGRPTAGMPGLVTREGLGPPRPLIEDLSTLPLPARDLLPNGRYRYPLCGAGRMTTLMTSRGCPFSCVFCDKGIFGSRWRARDAEGVLAEIDEVVARHGVKSIVFYDDLFTLDKRRLRALCQGLLRRDYRISWKAEGRVDPIPLELLKLMRRAGCDTLAYGVESANQVGLDYIGKKTTPEMAREAFRLTREAGIRTMGYFILGIPAETYEQALNTIRFSRQIKADFAQFSVLSPLPGTPLYEQAVAKGWYREIPAHNVADKDRLRPVVISENWDEQKLISIVHAAHRQFYLRPGYIIRSLLRVRSLRELGRLVKLGLGVVRYVFSGSSRARAA